MSMAMLRMTRLIFLVAAVATLTMIASAASAACRTIVDEDGDTTQRCGNHAPVPSVQGQNRVQAGANNDDDDDDEDDDDNGNEFTYDEDQGSLLVDHDDCAPGKFWMMDNDGDGVMLPCGNR